MKNWKWISLSLASTALLAACGNGGSTADSSAEAGSETSSELTVSTFAIGEDVIRADVFAPFEEENGITIVAEVGNSSERFTKFQNNPNNTIDVIELSQANAASGVSEDLFEPLDETKVPNIANLIDSAKELTEDGSGPAYTINSIGIIYDEAAAGMTIDEWSDLWDPALAGKISIPDITTTFGPAMIHVASDFKGTDITTDNGTAAFEALTELKPNIVKTYTKSSDLANMFQSGEIVAAVVGDFAYPIISGSNPGVQYVVPESGTYANFNTLNVNKNSENKELAYAYINWKLSKELQEVTAISLNEAPTNKEVALDEATAANKTYGAVAERAKAIDFTFVNENYEAWIAEWNKTLNQ